MSFEKISEWDVHITGRTPLQMAKGLLKLAEATEGEDDIGKRKVLEEIEGNKTFFPYGGRVTSLVYQGHTYHLKYGIDREVGWLAVSRGETPSVEPLRETAEMWDRLIEESAK